ncbi:MAG: rhomboid family intramembrane serine protease [Rubrobacter sp.]|jgi:membrane associated rhomboid family serine protease|nr:rhomboid family intramembrane serine protease [Rubrobacter sp.]
MNATNTGRTETLSGEIKLHAAVLGGALAVMWLLEIADLLVFGGGLDAYGIRPRSVEGLSGILLAPFLHGGFIHLAGNSIPFLVFGSLVLFHEIKDFLVATALAVLVGGLGAWLLGGSETVHIGASGLVFGYFGYLLLRGYFRRSVGAIALSVILAVSYGWMLFGVLPFQPGAVSWQGHLFGFLGGALSAYLLRRPNVAPHR